MGAFTSTHTQITDSDDDAIISEGTPRPTHVRNQRILNSDPRSPSECISRTPIVVDRTPSQSLSSKLMPQRISALMKDPRSPTTDFTRTPLSLGHGKGQELPVNESALSNDSLSSESGIESANITPVTKRVIDGEKTASLSPDSALSDEVSGCHCNEDNATGSQRLEAANGEQSGTLTESLDDAPLLAKDLQGVPISHNNEKAPLVQIKNNPESRLKLRHLNLVKKMDSTSMEPKNLRSPLSYVDNSPRYGRLSKSSKLPVSNGNDDIQKENVCH